MFGTKHFDDNGSSLNASKERNHGIQNCLLIRRRSPRTNQHPSPSLRALPTKGDHS